ncbi:MAG TPA: prephenate dehydratase, partial [Brevundimonas sp.]|nr:prephenate dehydratase [Brevundimonas sp.]
AAVAPARAAEVYGLSVLRNDLQDFSDNRTRFVLFVAPEA